MIEASAVPGSNPAQGEREFQSSIASMRSSLKARADARRGIGARLADTLTFGFGSMPFLVVNCIWFAVWIAINLGFVPAVPVFDPFPFGLLTMIVSLEAIVLAIVVLVSQNRASRLADLREETALHVEEISENEVTKVLELLVKLLEKQGIDVSQDRELRAMLRHMDTDEIIEKFENEVGT